MHKKVSQRKDKGTLGNQILNLIINERDLDKEKSVSYSFNLCLILKKLKFSFFFFNILILLCTSELFGIF